MPQQLHNIHEHIDLPPDPLAVLERAPVDRPLFMLSSSGEHPRWARWSILALPRCLLQIDTHGARWIGETPPALDQIELDRSPLEVIQQAVDAAHCPQALPGELPFAGGWIGWFSYDLGEVIEPAIRTQQLSAPRAVHDRPWPLVELAWCESALLLDHQSRRWYRYGNEPIEDLIATSDNSPSRTHPEYTAGSLRPTSFTPDEYLQAIEQTIEYIAAGDIFQANITHRLSTEFSGSSRSLAANALAINQPWYGAYMELPDGRALISVSPELFLHYDSTSRRIVTRPIKGTLPASDPVEELAGSSKDAAELIMIVDLMRNDLGRFCEIGSISVPRASVIETHGSVHQGVGEVVGTAREGATFTEMLAATFPCGSVTGAPKIRAMQIIDELEPMKRGPYCGSMGYISRCGSFQLNVAIRTMALWGSKCDPQQWHRMDNALLDYGCGGGIVADSTPLSEYREAQAKAEPCRSALYSCAIQR